jgi:hypothetical protein
MNDYDKRWCSKLLSDVRRLPISSSFREPVDPVRDGVPDYHQIVNQPMDLRTMKRKLSASEYGSVQAFIDDIQLICDNAKKFHGAKSIFRLIAHDIMAEVNQRYNDKPSSLDDEWVRAIAEAMREFEKHITDAPQAISLSCDDLQPPDLEKLSEAQKSAVRKVIGGRKLENIGREWLLLNDAIKASIISAIGRASPQ